VQAGGVLSGMVEGAGFRQAGPDPMINVAMERMFRLKAASSSGNFYRGFKTSPAERIYSDDLEEPANRSVEIIMPAPKSACSRSKLDQR